MLEPDSDDDHAARKLLLTCYARALQAVSGRRLVARALSGDTGPVHLVAVGKAAAAMAEGAFDSMGDGILRGLLVSKRGHLGPPCGEPRFRCLEAGHPRPDAASLAAGAALLDFIDATPADGRLLFLISGGASALVEALPDGVTLQDLGRLNDWLLGSGLDIARMNRLRKAISLIKGGRLGARLGGRPASCLLLSDVPGDVPAVIGSGPLTPDPEAGLPLPTLPGELRRLLERAPPPAEALSDVSCRIIAGNGDARHAAEAFGREHGLPVFGHDGLLTGDAAETGEQLARRLLQGPPGLYVWGGETSVRLPPAPGHGGRCQALALAAAGVLAGARGVWLLAAGSDGSDGPTEDAGALVDAATLQRGLDAGFDPAQCAAAADSGTFLEASGDLVQTGPTGTNVMDLVLAWKGELPAR